MTRKHETIPTWKKIAAGTTAAIGLLSLNACATDKGEPAPTPTATSSEITPSPSASENPAPSETPTGIETREPGLESFEIIAGLEDEELAEKFIGLATYMSNIGATQEFRQEALAVGQSQGKDALIEYCDTVARSNFEAIIPQLFTDSALNDKKTAKWLDTEEKINASTLYLYFLTSGGQEGDEEPYRRWRELTDYNVIESKDGVRKIKIYSYTYENTEKNRVDELGTNPAEGSGTLEVTFVDIDGRTFIESMDY